MPFFDSLKAQFKDLKAEGQKLMGSSQDPPPQHPYPQQQQGYYYPPQQQQQQYNRPPPPQPQSSYPGQQAQQQRQQASPNFPTAFDPPPPQQHGAPPQFQPANGGQQPIQGVYWSARFDPNTAVSQEWEEKEGNNNGWGNNELQHYTNQRENSF